MKIPALKILPAGLLETYQTMVSDGSLKEKFTSLEDAQLSNADFSFYTSVASVYSSKIEGETIELDSYIKYKRFGVDFKPDHTRKIDDLYEAYEFAKKNSPTQKNISKAHALLTKHILTKSWQGKTRNQNMYVTTSDGKIEYVACQPHEVAAEMEKLSLDLEKLLGTDLSISEIFFFASLLHLVFVKIHPWNDGNGRSARLLEKWFIADKLGEKAWFIQSEKHYYVEHNQYYRNIRQLGIEYPSLDYTKALDFLLMLPNALLNDK